MCKIANKGLVVSQIMSSNNDDLSNKRKQSLAQEKNIDSFPQGARWKIKGNKFARFCEKLLGYASIPLMMFLSVIFLCFVAGLGLFLGICRLLALIAGLFNHTESR
jgi:hypothetical protein